MMKKLTKSYFYCHKSAQSWYPIAHECMSNHDVKVIHPLPVENINAESSRLEEFAATCGRPVSQKTNR